MNKWLLAVAIATFAFGVEAARASFYCSGTLRAKVNEVIKLPSDFYLVKISVLEQSGCHKPSGESFAIGDVTTVRLTGGKICRLCLLIKVGGTIELGYHHVDSMGPNGVVTDEAWELFSVDAAGEDSKTPDADPNR